MAQQSYLYALVALFEEQYNLAQATPYSGARLTSDSPVEAHGNLVTIKTEHLESLARNSGVDLSSIDFSTFLSPRLVYFRDELARPGYNSKQAHEYEEEPSVLRQKIKLLAALVLHSDRCVAYTGAGISTASGIADYATKGQESTAFQNKPRIKNSLLAEPTLSHRVLVALNKIGKLKHWVQQNHDGLPQKAFFPQESLNEIHGAWFDPSNPVVPMSGSLRHDLFEDLNTWSTNADLCLTLGTSLCGMNADSLVTKTAMRASWRWDHSSDNRPKNNNRKFDLQKLKQRYPSALGSVIVSLQQTQYDELCSLRIFAKLDIVFALLAAELQDILNTKQNLDFLGLITDEIYKGERLKDRTVIPEENVVKNKKSGKVEEDTFIVPYDEKTGELLKNLYGKKCVWSLKTGSKIKLTQGPGEGFVGTIIGKSQEGHYSCRLPYQKNPRDDDFSAKEKNQTTYLLGAWWVEAAIQGKVQKLPFVNIN